jgi:hypothetical protein
MDDGPVLWCKDLRKRFKERLAVDGVGFEVAPGETYGLLGPNGAGKTTTISMICGLLRRDGGEVTVAGASLDRDPGQVKAAIGYVPQDVALDPDLSGLENLRFWGRMYGLAGRELEDRVGATLEVVGLAERAGDKVAAYSGACSGGSTSPPGCCTGRGCWCWTSRRPGSTRRAATPSSATSRRWAARAWPCSTPPTTWRRPSGSATGSGSSTRAAWSRVTGPPVGIALGMLGGCMWPLAIVPAPMRTFGHLFPQAWAMDTFIALIARNAGLAGILRQLAVLAAFAAALLALAAWRLRRTLVG